MSAKETTIYNPKLLELCTFILICFSSATKKKYKLKHIDGWLPVAVFFLFYILYAFISWDVLSYIHWIIGGVYIVYSSKYCRGQGYATLVMGFAIFALSWNNTVSYHGFAVGMAVIIITICISYLDKRQINNLLYKQLGVAGTILLAASNINPLGGAWILSFIKTSDTNTNSQTSILQSIEGIGFCTLGWLLVPLVLVQGISNLHILELLLTFFIFAITFTALFVLRNINNITSRISEIKDIIYIDSISFLTAGCLVCTGTFPIILFDIVFILYILNLIIQGNDYRAQSCIKPVVVISNKDDTHIILQTLTLLKPITEPVQLLANPINQNTENILASSMAELIGSGYSIIPQSIDIESFTIQETAHHDTIPVLIAANQDILKKLPVLTKKFYVFLNYKFITSKIANNKITIIGSLERTGKNSFTAYAPLIRALFQNNKTDIVQLIAIGNLAQDTILKNSDTGIKYTYCLRTELQSLQKRIPPQNNVFILCDDSPGWPPADFRIPDIIAETHTCFLVFSRVPALQPKESHYPQIVEQCIQEKRIVTFGDDSAIADAIKALLVESFKDFPKEADTMASIFYPRAFLEPIMLDSGIMLLHARNKKLSIPILSIALSPNGWRHLAQKQPVHCILMLLSPETISAQEHLDNLSALVHAIRDMNLIQSLMKEVINKHNL